jgi:hypothetical protein
MAGKVPNQNSDGDKTFVYFVRSGEFIKIGQSRRWRERLPNMQTGSPHTLIVLLVLIAEPKLEGKLHNWFRTDHFRGEWFHSGPAILAYIREHLPECVSKSTKSDLRVSKAVSWDDEIVL